MEKELQEKTKLHISVRDLVEFILREGDIDNRGGGIVTADAMMMGSRLHRKIQQSMKGDYQAEVPLKYLMETKLYDLTIEGRADGIFTNADGIVVIDEIKGTYRKLEYMEQPILVHQGQAMCYAYMFAKQNGLEQIAVQMTYVNMDTEEKKYFQQEFPFVELEEWFWNLLKSYKRWADFQCQWKQKRQSSIQSLEFPFAYRKGQKQLVGDVYRTILRRKNLFIQAPTGVGKTISTVFPAVKAVGENLAERIFYLTAKTITATVARDTFQILEKQGYQAKTIQITAKEKLCMCEEMECNPVNCPYAKGHFDRVNDAVFEMLQSNNLFTREAILMQAEKHRVCPFEMSLDVASWADNIICDYNYVFDPHVCLKRFFQQGVKGDYIFLVDEAHNLVERSREMYSAVIYKEDILAAKHIMKNYSKKITGLLERCNKILLEYKRECENYTLHEDTGNLLFVLKTLLTEIETFLLKPSAFRDRREEFAEKSFERRGRNSLIQTQGVFRDEKHYLTSNEETSAYKEGLKPDTVRSFDFSGRKELLDFYFQISHFVFISDLVDEHYEIYSEIQEDGRFMLKLFCVDPSENLQKCIDKGNSTVFFSATLLPIQYYKSLLSTDKENYAIYAETAFSEKNRLLLVGNDVSTKYTRRSEKEFERIAAYIVKTVYCKKGNYMVFFPSYKFMHQVYDSFLMMDKGRTESVMQENGMKETEREEFLLRFEKEYNTSFVAFCVMGGIFSEGIDLTRDKLIGAIVVGTGLPQISNEREILRKHYDEIAGNGFDYAFRFPGMNKVLQAAGRVIRTTEDIGVILLLDERFLQAEYQMLYPREWQKRHICNIYTVEQQLSDFWQSERK